MIWKNCLNFTQTLVLLYFCCVRQMTLSISEIIFFFKFTDLKRIRLD